MTVRNYTVMTWDGITNGVATFLGYVISPAKSRTLCTVWNKRPTNACILSFV